MENLSHHHHYIPEFFIKGFINPSKQMWRYDKKTDRISTKQFYPKAIFYKDDINMIVVKNKDVDIIESKIYKYLDDFLAPQFKILQGVSNPDFTDNELFYYINLMASTLYYRTPSSEVERSLNFLNPSFINSINDSQLREEIISTLNLNISEEDKVRLLNTKLPLVGLHLNKKNEFKPEQYYSNFNLNRIGFVLSDFPIITKETPNNFNDIASNLIFPLTSKRLFYSISDKFEKINLKKIMNINLLLALQAKEFICSEDKEILEVTVNMYRKIKDENISLNIARKRLFKLIID